MRSEAVLCGRPEGDTSALGETGLVEAMKKTTVYPSQDDALTVRVDPK